MVIGMFFEEVSGIVVRVGKCCFWIIVIMV